MRYKINNFLNFIYLFFLISSFGQNEKSIIDSLKLNKIGFKRALIVVNNQLSYKELSINNRALLYEFKAKVLRSKFNYYSAIDLNKDSYQLFKDLNNVKSQIRLLNEIAEIYIEIEDFSNAITTLNDVELITANDKENNKIKTAHYLSNLGRMFYKTGDYDKAQKYFHQSFNGAIQNNNLNFLNKSYLDFASVFIKIKELDSAMYYVDKVLSFSEKNKIFQLLSNALVIKGDIYKLKNDFILAERYYKRAIYKIKKKGGNTSILYTKLGNFYSRVYLFDEADKNLTIAAKQLEERKDIVKLQNVYHDLVENSLQQKKPKKALYFLNKFDSIHAIRQKEIKENNMAYVNERYSIQQAQIKYINDRNELLKKERELYSQREISKKNSIIFFIIVILLAVISLGLYLYYRYNKLRIEKLNWQLKNTVLRLQMNPHFIFNSLTAIQNSILKNDQLKSAELIAVFSKLIRQNLDFSNRKSISLAEEIDMLTNYLETQKFRFDNLFEFEFEIDDDVDSDNTQIPPMLLQPFIENSIEHGLKHRKKDGLITIKVTKIEKGIHICIEDNGVGRFFAKRNNKNDDDKNKIHAIKIFKERLKNRKKNEILDFKIEDVFDENRSVIGTKVSFNIKD